MAVGDEVDVPVGELTGVLLLVGVAVELQVEVGLAVKLLVAVLVLIGVELLVQVMVGDKVEVEVAVCVSLLVSVSVAVEVRVGVFVGVEVKAVVAVFVTVKLGVGEEGIEMTWIAVTRALSALAGPNSMVIFPPEGATLLKTSSRALFMAPVVAKISKLVRTLVPLIETLKTRLPAAVQ
jgi:hypothetical protein